MQGSWFAIDTGVWLVPTAYTLKHARGYSNSALRNWKLEVGSLFMSIVVEKALSLSLEVGSLVISDKGAIVVEKGLSLSL